MALSRTRSYKCITVDGKQLKLHRYVMSQYLGRPLRDDELVHHRDRDIHNNDLYT